MTPHLLPRVRPSVTAHRLAIIATAALAVAVPAAAQETAGIVSVRATGAIGDGGSHPLSSRFASLADARAVYPRAAGLREEIDAHALQKAIDEAPVGGTVILPPGQYVVNFTVKIWKGITVQGTGTFHTRPEYEHHAQLLVRGEIAALAFDEEGHPPGVKPKAYREEQARITGIKFRGESASPEHRSIGVLFHVFRDGEIDHCHFAALGTAVATNGSWVWSVHDNVMKGCGYGIRHDVSFQAAGTAPGRWYQVNAARIERNHLNGDAYGILLYGVGSAISIRDNTLENCSQVALSLASYPKEVSGSPDAHHGLRAVEVRGNYFEKNGLHVELGREAGSARETARTAIRDSLIVQNFFNMDALAAHRAVHVHALAASRIADNSVRYGSGEPFDVAFDVRYDGQDVALVEDVEVVAERGWSGYPLFSRDGSCSVRTRAPVNRDYALVHVSPSRAERVRNRRQAYAMNAGTPSFPLESLALLPAYLSAKAAFIPASASLDVLLEPGAHPAIAVPPRSQAITLRPAPGTSREVTVRGLSCSGGAAVRVSGEGRLVIEGTETGAALSFSGVAATVSGVRVAWPGPRGPKGSAALRAGDGAVVSASGLTVERGQPEHGVIAAGATVLLGSEPPAGYGAVNLLVDAERGGLIVRRPSETRASAPPRSGRWDAGEVVWNAVPAVGRPAGWICVEAGTPGVWRPLAELR